MLTIIWRWFSSIVTIAVISLALAFALVESFAREGAVIRRIGKVDNPSTKVKAGGKLSYGIDVERLESCPGDVVTSFRSLSEPTRVLTIPRPLSGNAYTIGVRPHAEVSYVLPPEIGVGRWTYQSSVASQCPTRQRADEIASFDFEVVP